MNSPVPSLRIFAFVVFTAVCVLLLMAAIGIWHTIHLLHQKFYLRPAAFTPYEDVPPCKAFILFFAPHLPGSETLYQRACTSS